MTEPSVTVVIPAFNRESMVRRAVLSAQLQTRKPSEVIVVDDGSSDRTAEFAAALGATVITQPNGGLSAARNTGLRAAKTPWVAFLDSDDEWLPQHLSTLSTWFLPQYALVASNARGVPSGRLVGHPGKSPLELTVERLIWPESPLIPSAAVVRRDLAVQAGGFPDVRLGEDRLFWCQLVESMGGGVVLPQVTCLYHEHQSQMSGNAEAMRQARDEILAGLLLQGSISARIVESISVTSAWDRLRERRDSRPAAAAVTTLVKSPSSTRALVETLVYRHRLRRRKAL